MLQIVIDGILTVNQRNKGFIVQELDDHFVAILNLKLSSEPLATFSQAGTTVQSLRNACDVLAVKYGI